jgi:hypothetical protein
MLALRQDKDMRMPEPRAEKKPKLCTMLNGQACAHFNGCIGSGITAEVICGPEFISTAKARQCTTTKRNDEASHAIGKK